MELVGIDQCCKCAQFDKVSVHGSEFLSRLVFLLYASQRYWYSPIMFVLICKEQRN